MSANNCFIKKNIKKKSDFSRTNQIRLALFSFAKDEINEKRKLYSDSFSFSSQSLEKPNENKESKYITKAISLNSQKTSDDSFDLGLDEEDSSEMSCEEE